MSIVSLKSEVGSKRADTWNQIKKHRSIYLFISPFFILFFVFGLFPIIFSLYLSFHAWDGLSPMRFIGFKNFQLLLTDTEFWDSVKNTFIIWLESTIPMLFFALVIAFFLNSAFVRLKGFWRFTFFLPNITSIVAEAVLFSVFFNTKFGIFNFILGKFGMHAIDWLDVNGWLQLAIAILVIWRWTGYNAIIYLAGLQAIPTDLYEAARIDGASTVQIFFRITIPLLRPIIFFTVIMSTIGGMQIFTEPQILTNGTGGPGLGGNTMVLYLYNQAFTNHLFGYGSAIGWALFIIILAFSLLNSLVINKIAKQ
ncbi:sugar ABC transporter permease [Alicyclobacillus fastidiosus]|uniref:Sugar ABC transporter permease n=1 Tax=Alicyclobacillus fastidiosus TaxID=392011 RepID=A0ABY6ZMH5_9BACL|nr:sugar ABC transporter permease [Alicyclobacillus fastidiosus]WAH44145.1 sugar ABC transporter permease [Alicyclobacillus fastidiosus]GMA60448.1 cytochrome c biogenesis protein [Alicyclobacillus fastidiosus]